MFLEFRTIGGLTSIAGIGAELAVKTEKMLSTGRLEFYEKLSAEILPSLVDMLHLVADKIRRRIPIGMATGTTAKASSTASGSLQGQEFHPRNALAKAKHRMAHMLRLWVALGHPMILIMCSPS